MSRLITEESFSLFYVVLGLIAVYLEVVTPLLLICLALVDLMVAAVIIFYVSFCWVGGGRSELRSEMMSSISSDSWLIRKGFVVFCIFARSYKF